MQLYTAKLTSSGDIEKLGLKLLDITVLSGVSIYAPKWDMLKKYKSGKMDPEEYTELYLSLMRDSYSKNKEKWLELFTNKNLVLGCYCNPGDFCHRNIMVHILHQIAKKENFNVTYRGDIERLIHSNRKAGRTMLMLQDTLKGYEDEC